MVQIQQVALFWVVASLLLGMPALAQQTEEDEPKPPRSYIGIGGNIGLSGDDSAIGEGGFAIVNRTRIIDYLSVRSSTIFGDETTSAIALTGEVPLTNANGRITAIPFIGGGVSIHGEVDPLISAGVDVPIGRSFTATTRVNVGFGDNETDVGLILGIGYNFSLF
ncbi:MAG: hypothetical protein AAF827_15870 [Cyanobacteria bacterium P01_D01_bin.6]